MIDIHCHLEYIKNPQKIISRALRKKMKGIITSVVDPKKSSQILSLREKFPHFLFVSLGFHPEEIKNYNEKEFLKYLNFIKKNKNNIVAIGEVGLDYWYHKSPKEKETSKKFLKIFLNLAKELNLPVVIHCREAFKDLFLILEEEKMEKICLHCFSGSEGILKEAIKRNYIVSFATNICYTKKHPRLCEKTPLESMVLETDSPWLNPFYPQKIINRPWNILKSAEIISKIHQIPLEKVLEITTENAKNFFNLPF